MIDFHCHLDLYRNPLSVFEEAKKRNSFVLAVTTSPRAFIETSCHFKPVPNIMVAIGFHPELISSRLNERSLFIDNIEKCPMIGEVGIDGSIKNKDSLTIQRSIFEETIVKSNDCGGKIISIHSRGATSDVLRVLERNHGKSVPVLHWFTGSQKELDWAISIGCWFSINPNMCITKSGIKTIARIPIDRILPETDAPFVQKNGVPYMPWDNTVTSYLSNYYNMQFDDMKAQLHNNLKTLLNNRGNKDAGKI